MKNATNIDEQLALFDKKQTKLLLVLKNMELEVVCH